MQIVVFHSYFTEFIINGTKGPNEKQTLGNSRNALAPNGR